MEKLDVAPTCTMYHRFKLADKRTSGVGELEADIDQTDLATCGKGNLVRQRLGELGDISLKLLATNFNDKFPALGDYRTHTHNLDSFI
jgi:hypothetical protein